MKYSSLDQSRFDVIVGGAGSAGIAAAWAAAQEGANTLLLERLGFGGGIITAAMIHTLDAVKDCRTHSEFVVGGFTYALLREIEALGGYVTRDNPGEALAVHPEYYKVAVDRVLRSNGVKVLYDAPICGVLQDGNRVVGVEAALRDGRARFHASTVVDCTGDAELAYHAGAAWTLDPELQALTYHFRLGAVDLKPDWRDWEALTRAALNAAQADGEIELFGGPWVIRMHETEISMNTTRVYGNPVDPIALTDAECNARAQMLDIVRILQRRVPELARCYILSGASQLHIRESRKIVGEYTLTEDDIRSGRAFPDTIAMGAWPIDIHPTKKSGVHPHKDDAPVPYQIPYRCLVPQAVDGLLIAGKPISTTHRAHGSTRVPGTSMATGQAAGVAAALAAAAKIEPRRVDPSRLVARLRAKGAVLSWGAGGAAPGHATKE